ncbi:DUF2612 domain-containing protein [Salmonella enterica]|uniref:DUF2612 domain-containing protein n=1 Tax=Salmonella enterica TaxID=28901 RepID=UPI0018D16389|nr:DUF2612 domain-containing protein [Salmonella enterica]MBH0365705.1 DUF2612 domain-containing protein [Salmonella enterica]MBH0484053.1 DUF2612 domain-containing protein [Salmonella enterica]MBH5273468.1 DUF2612 domain-containing protein [Salmonella enterica]MBH5281905.1 DUF2612 domain-containing protein [Salmonella enterica]MDO3888132.1 DUF2612 domain-containing protein [Salmonella enterica]
MSDTIQEFQFSVDLLRALLWQYNDAENLQGILQKKKDWYINNHEQFWRDWYTNVFNMDTANSFGLSVWAIILGIPLVVTSDTPNPNKPTWGFAATHKNFNNGNFQHHFGDEITLTTEQKRMVLKLRYFYLVSRGTIPEMNQVLKYVFGNRGGGYVIDNYDMSAISVIFDFKPNESIRFVMDKYNIFPRPAGVGLKYEFRNSNRKVWAFGDERNNFRKGNFKQKKVNA